MNSNIPALSIRQPWAWAILYAGKSIENRGWSTSYRGRIRIHAAKTWDEDGEAWIAHQGLLVPNQLVCRDQGTLGAYVGEADLLWCEPVDDYLRAQHAPWAFGPVCWHLGNVTAYPEPIPGRGFPGLYYPEQFKSHGR